MTICFLFRILMESFFEENVMSAINTNSSSTITSHSMTAWITPKEALELIVNQIAEDSSTALKVSTVVRELIPAISKIIAQYSLDTEWYDALDVLGILPEEIPRPPNNILQILSGKSAIHHNKKKVKNSYTIENTHTLLLFPGKLTLNQFREKIVSYGEKQYPGVNNPFDNPYFNQDSYYNTDCLCERAFGNMPFGQTQWVLITGVLPKSDSFFKTRKMKDRMIDDLSKKSYIDYEISSLQSSITALFLHYVATGKSLYQDDFSIAVKEKIAGQRVVIMGCLYNDKLHLFFARCCGKPLCDVSHGISAIRRF